MPFAGLYLEAHDIMSNYLVRATPSLGETHPDILRAVVTQAFNTWCNGGYREAANLYKLIYRVYERTIGIEDGETLFVAQGVSLSGAYIEGDDEVSLKNELIIEALVC
jgi:hypothetical protein